MRAWLIAMLLAFLGLGIGLVQWQHSMLFDVLDRSSVPGVRVLSAIALAGCGLGCLMWVVIALHGATH